MAFPKFTEGPATRPAIHHDHGFLDDGNGNIDPKKRRAATWEDYKVLAWWAAKLNGAEMLRPDLKNATDAYRHFLDNTGTDFDVDYEAFVRDDKSGETVLNSAIEDTIAAAIEIDDKKVGGATPSAPKQDDFSITSEAIGVGGRNARYPYPKTENWQKAIGAHFIWMDAAVKVKIDPAAGKRQFEVKMHLHMEDMYNFNPGAHDIATGTPDADNGRFEVSGLAKEFLSKAEISRTLKFTEPITPVPDTRAKPADLDVSRR
jgi:hypothetical protein